MSLSSRAGSAPVRPRSPTSPWRKPKTPTSCSCGRPRARLCPSSARVRSWRSSPSRSAQIVPLALQGGDAADLTPSQPPVGRFDGHEWGDLMATMGRNDGYQWGISWPPVGRNRWPLTARPMPLAGTAQSSRERVRRWSRRRATGAPTGTVDADVSADDRRATGSTKLQPSRCRRRCRPRLPLWVFEGPERQSRSGARSGDEAGAAPAPSWSRSTVLRMIV